ncbi:MAG: branched-chain amino acid transaminase, partial [Dehalococcoidia bacterium]|nr:branched-chain amino acid transaminase [Dehalococcoidia bacterium]
FRVQEHCERLLCGCKLLMIKIPYTVDQMTEIIRRTVEKSGFKEDVYVRPLAFKSEQRIGVRLHDVADDFLVAVTTLPPYLNTEEGCKACISPWRRVDDTMISARGKITGIYVNSALAKSEAILNGFDEAIMLSMDGHVSEGTGENIFLVMKGKLYTPPSSDNILLGVTRDSIMKIAKNELGIDTTERPIDRSELYLADECFFTGTAAHVTPIISIDHRPVGNGKVGPITAKLQKLYFDIIHGRNPKYLDWCLPVYPEP